MVSDPRRIIFVPMGTLVFYNWPRQAAASDAPWDLGLFWEDAALARVTVQRTREGPPTSASSAVIILFVDVPPDHFRLDVLTDMLGRAWWCRDRSSACAWVPESKLPPVGDEQSLTWPTSHAKRNMLDASWSCADMVLRETYSETVKRRAKDAQREIEICIRAAKRARLDEGDAFAEVDAVNNVFMQHHLPRETVSHFIASGATLDTWPSPAEWSTDTSDVRRLTRYPCSTAPTMTLRDGLAVLKAHLRDLVLFELKRGPASCIRPGVIAAPKEKLVKLKKTKRRHAFSSKQVSALRRACTASIPFCGLGPPRLCETRWRRVTCGVCTLSVRFVS